MADAITTDLTEAADAAMNRTRECSVPLAIVEGGRPTESGSGILLKVADEGFLLTAAHIFGRASPSSGGSARVSIAGKPGVSDAVSVERFQLIASANSENQRHPASDRTDVAVVRLHPADLPELEKAWSFLRLNEIEVGQLSVGDMILVWGFPHDLATVDEEAREMDRDHLQYVAPVVEAPDEFVEFDELSHIAVSYDERTAINDDGDLVGLPHPGGLSGCGMWRVSPDRENGKLVGLQHRWSSTARAIRGTRVTKAIWFLYYHSPHLRAAMEIAQPNLAVFHAKWLRRRAQRDEARKS